MQTEGAFEKHEEVKVNRLIDIENGKKK